MITYKTVTVIKVYLNGRLVGEIRQVPANCWQYWPKDAKEGGDVFKSEMACKASLE